MAPKNWAEAVTQNMAIKLVMKNRLDHGLKGDGDAAFVMIASKTFDINLDRNKKWQIYKTGLDIKDDPAGLLRSLKEQDLLHDIEDIAWIKKYLKLLDLADSIYSYDVVPNRWKQLDWITEVFSGDEQALFVALKRCDNVLLTPPWLHDRFKNHYYVAYLMKRQFGLEYLTSDEDYFEAIAYLTTEEFLFDHLLGTGALYRVSCDFLRKVLSTRLFYVAIIERLDKLEL